MLARQGDLVLLIHPAGGPFTDRLLGLLADSARAGQSPDHYCQANSKCDSPAPVRVLPVFSTAVPICPSTYCFVVACKDVEGSAARVNPPDKAPPVFGSAVAT